MKDRIFKNPLTSLVGVGLIGAGIYVFTLADIEESSKLVVTTLLIGLGAVALGLKDGNVKTDA